jgi:hypothetical protein
MKQALKNPWAIVTFCLAVLVVGYGAVMANSEEGLFAAQICEIDWEAEAAYNAQNQ